MVRTPLPCVPSRFDSLGENMRTVECVIVSLALILDVSGGGEQTQGLQKEAENRQRGAQSSQLISPQDNSDHMYEGIF